MLVNQIRFGSLLTYCPHGRMLDATNEERHSVGVMHALKDDELIPDPDSTEGGLMLMSSWVAREVSRRMGTLPFRHYFGAETVLIPMPKSGKMLENELWVPFRIAKAMNAAGIGRAVIPSLIRATPIRKAAWSPSWERPTAQEHFDTMAVETMTKPDQVVLVDDVVTTGATLLGGANRLMSVFPDVKISAFAAIRTQSNRLDFEYDAGAVEGTITLQDNGWTKRSP